MATENVKERSQAGAEPTLLATLVGKVRQIIVNTTTFRPHIMDGSTPGGHPLAFKKEIDGIETSLSAFAEFNEAKGL